MSRQSRSKQSSQRGFTLIEILVVMVIIGIMVTFATLSVSTRALDDKLKTEAQRIEQLLQIASEDAEQQGIEIGFVYTDSGYAFLSVTPSGRWAPITSGPLRQRRLPQPMRLQMRAEEQIIAPISDKALEAAAKRASLKDVETKPGAGTVDPQQGESMEDAKLALKPQALLLSSGEASAIKLDISAPGVDSVYRVAVDELGHIQRTVLDTRKK